MASVDGAWPLLSPVAMRRRAGWRRRGRSADGVQRWLASAHWEPQHSHDMASLGCTSAVVLLEVMSWL